MKTNQRDLGKGGNESITADAARLCKTAGNARDHVLYSGKQEEEKANPRCAGTD